MSEYERELGGSGNGDPEARGRSPEEIEREIEATRERMGRDIDELGERLSPSNLKRQAKDAITGKAQDIANNVGESARSHRVTDDGLRLREHLAGRARWGWAPSGSSSSATRARSRATGWRGSPTPGRSAAERGS